MKKLLLKLYIVCCSFAWSADSEYGEPKEFTNPNGTFKPEVSSEMGIGRIERDPMYYTYAYGNSSTQGACPQTFGVYSKGIKQSGIFSLAETTGIPTLKSTNFRGLENARTITNDIRCALLDKDYFDTLLAEGDYIEAYHFSPDNAQGHLWKRQVIATLKKEIDSLILRSIYFDDSILQAKADFIIDDFKTTDHHEEIYNFYNDLKGQYSRSKNELIQSLHARGVETSDIPNFIKMMFGDLK